MRVATLRCATRRRVCMPRCASSLSAHADSPEALRALELFLKVATPEASGIVDDFLAHRSSGTATLDSFLLRELHGDRGAADGPVSAFATEWKAFAAKNIAKDRANVATKAWAQHRAYPPASALSPIAIDRCPVAAVELDGVVRLPELLDRATATQLRAAVLAQRDESRARVQADPAAFGSLFSRVLSPTDTDATAASRWDVRLPWNGDVRAAVTALCRGPLGGALRSLSGGGDAELWECAAIVVASGAAPQILHGDTHFQQRPQVFTAFVALQNTREHQGPTRFVPRSHTGSAGAREHRALGADAERYCAATPSKLGLLSCGDAVVMDSRILHGGGPYTAAPPVESSAASGGACAEGGVAAALEERVMLCLSFRHTAAAGSLCNGDAHGAGSIRPEVAALGLTLDQIIGDG
jgi:hypothetical protein